MTREEGLKILKEKIKNENLIKHSLAVEAILRKLAIFFKEDEEEWGLAGLLHDIDYEETKNNPEKHSLIGAKFLESLGLNKKIVQAIRVHNEIHNLERETNLDKALYCVDPLTGLIVAATLVLPSRKIKDLTVENVLNRFKEKAFAKGAKRETILKCEELNLKLKDFIKIGLEAMQGIGNELGL